ncbi:MAG TPA: MFS transporter [Anaerolineae bacterium]|nr:MFS transporter [Anaerolineae bacterium]
MFQAFRNRNIALLFTGQFASLAGDMVLFIALPFWVFQLTGSAMATGIMFAALMIPQFVLSPIAGVFVDRLDRKRLMIASDLIRGALMLGYLFVNTADQVWIIYLLAFSESAVSQFFRPSVMAVVPTLVNGEEELTRANAALGASQALAQLAGPALGGVLVATFGPHSAALFDSASYLFSALMVLLLQIPLRQTVAAQAANARQAVTQITEELAQGIRVVLDRPILRIVFGSLVLLFLSQGIINVLLVVMVNQIWHVGATEFGWLISAQGIGGVIGTLVVGAIAARVSPRMMVIAGGLISGLVLLAIVNQPSIFVAIALILPAGVVFIAFDVGLMTLIQIGSDDSNRGRVSGLMQTTMAAAQLIAIASTSLLADSLGAVLLLDIASVLFAFGGLIAILVPRGSAPASTAAPTPQPAE